MEKHLMDNLRPLEEHYKGGLRTPKDQLRDTRGIHIYKVYLSNT